VVKDNRSFAVSLLLYWFFSSVFILWLSLDILSSLQLELVAFFLVVVAWVIILAWQIPKKYRYIQFNNYTFVISKGSLIGFFKSYFQTIFSLKRIRYDQIEFIRLDRWVNPKKKPQTFGRIEIKIDYQNGFQMYIPVNDMRELIRVFSKHRFQKKPRIIQKSDEWLFVFPNSPAYEDLKSVSGSKTENIVNASIGE
jgi:hypothetical protein